MASYFLGFLICRGSIRAKLALEVIQRIERPPSASKTSSAGDQNGKPISTKDLKSKLDKKQGITVVETLAPERYREAHIPGALNIPPERIKELAPQLLPNKDAEIITYCTNTH